MPLQNRVTPFGDIVAISLQGMFTGNRGIIHDPATPTSWPMAAHSAGPNTAMRDLYKFLVLVCCAHHLRRRGRSVPVTGRRCTRALIHCSPQPLMADLFSAASFREAPPKEGI